MSTYFKNYRYLFFVWAGAISYAQVYVGVHFPFDVLFGGILGCIIGWGTGKLFTQKFNRIDKFQ
jgi:undecaprenyl-diphosphatase